MTSPSKPRPTEVNESLRRRFEEAWMVGTPLGLVDCLPDQGHSEYLPTLEELVHIQLEFAWKTHAAGTGQRPESVESLLAQFPALQAENVLPGVLRQEYHGRRQAGDQPSPADYATAFPDINLDQLTVPPGETVGPTASDDTATEVTSAAHDDQSTLAMPSSELPVPVADDVTLSGPAPGTSVADDLTIRGEISSSTADDATLAGEDAGVFIDVGDDDDDTFDSGSGGVADSIAVELGEQIPGYELLGELGRGGMGVVYRALDKKLKRVVALKMVLAGAHAGADELKRFQREAEAVARLQHPSIVQIHEVGEHNGQPYIALEYVDGGGLDSKIAGEPQTPAKAARWVEQLATAVGYAHEQNIVHRDLKPANVLLTSDGQPKITDFGLAKKIEDGVDVSQTASGSIMGTPSYMAPEQAGAANAVLGPSTDVYALGAILYCLLTGRPPFQSSSAMDTVMQVIEQDPVPPCQLVSGLDRNLETITLKCLQKDPDKRYQTAGELAEELRRFQNGEPILARPVGPIIRVAKWCRRKPLMATLWGSVAALVAFVTVNGYYEAQTQAELARQADENRQVAEIHKHEANRTAKLAVEARVQIRQRAITLNLDEGTRLLDRNQPTNALARFAAAFELQASGNNPLQTKINRVRLGSVIRLCPRPTAIWPLTTANVTFCDFTADGKIAVIGEFNGMIRLFNAETGKPIGKPLENDGYVMSLALSPEGDKAAACIVYELAGTIPESRIHVWNLKTQENTRVRGMKHTGMAEVLGYHPDGKRLLTCEVRKAGDKRDAILWDSESGKKLLAIEHSADIRWAGFFPDGRRLATVNGTDKFRIWDCQTGKQTGRSLGHSNQSLRLAAISGDGSRITTVGYNTARTWDATTLAPLTRELQLGSGIKDVQFSHDGSLLLATLHNWNVRVWDTVTGSPRLSPLRHDSNVIRARFSPDDRLIVTGSADGTARIWSTTSGQLEATFRHNKPVIHVAFHPDCRRILTGSAVEGLLASSGADARLWDLAITRVFAETELKHDDVRVLAMSSDGELIATGGLDHRVRIWSSLHGTAVTGWLDLGEPVVDVSFHAQDKVVFAHGTGKIAAAWKVPSGQLIGKTIQVADGLEDAAMTPDGSVIATVSGSDKVQQWNAQTGASLAEAVLLPPSVTLPSNETTRRVLFSPSGDQLVGIHTGYPYVGMIRSWKTGSTTPGTLQVIGLRQGIKLSDSPPDALKLTAIPEAVTFSNDGKTCLLVSRFVKDFGNKREIQVITLDPQSTVFESPISITGEVTRAVFNPEGTAFLTASRDNSARIWNNTSGRPNTRPFEHDGDVEWAAFDAKGQLVVTCGRAVTDGRGVVRVWDVSTGFPVTTELEHPKAVRRAILAPDGSRVFTACDDGRVRVWQLPQETRTAGQVVQTASLLVGKSTDVTGHESFMAESDFHDDWKQLQQSAGELFTSSKKQVVAWHLDATSNMDILKDGPRYLNHLDVMIAIDDQPNWRIRRSEVLTGMGQFDRAMADYDVLTGRTSSANHIFSRAGFCALLAGRTKTLEQHTSVLVKRTENKKNPGALVSASALLLIAPNDQSKHAKLASQFLDRYLKKFSNTSITRFAQLLSGLAQIRIGKPETAIQRLNKMLTRLAQPQSKVHPSELAICHMSIALAHAAKGNLATADKSRQLASKLIENHSHSYRHSIYWHLCEVLRRELTDRGLKGNT